MITQIDHIALAVKDLDAAIDAYQRDTGFHAMRPALAAA